MAVTEAYTGTETVSTTEWSLTTDTSYDTSDAKTVAGIYQCFIDLNALVAGDEFQFRIYEKIISGGTQRVVEEFSFFGGQGKPIWVSPALMLMHGFDFTLKKIAGTDRSITWSIRSG